MSAAPIPEDMLQAYVDEQLSAAEMSEVERRLAQDAVEAQRAEAYRLQRRLLREAFDSVLREPLPQRLVASPIGRRAVGWQRIAAVLAWIALGAVLGWQARDQRGSRGEQTELVQRARMAHVIYSAENRRAVEVAASEEQDMIRWLSRRMNTAVRVPNLTEFGFEAMGGRLLPGSSGPACQLMYRNAAGKRLTIYLSRDPIGTQSVRYSDQDRVHVVFWSDGALAFAVSAELEREELARIASLIERESSARGS